MFDIPQFIFFSYSAIPGTVTNVEEGIIWLSYTYLYVRMRKNPQVYGINWDQLRDDPTLEAKRKEIITDAARRLDKAKMIRFDERTGFLHPTDLGRTASQFYIKYDTVEVREWEGKKLF